MKEKVVSRWGILLASALCNVCIGASYAWSVFQKPLINMFRWSLSDVSLTFTLHLAVLPIAMIVAGKLQDQYGPRFILVAGGLLFGLGIIASGFTSSLGYLYLVYGVMAGLGDGAIYACTIANTVKWFPDRKGLAGGMIVASMGLGAVAWAPLGNFLVENYGIFSTFRILGIVYLVIIVCAANFVDRPPSGYKSADWNPLTSISQGVIAVGRGDKTWREMLTDPMFYILWVMYILGAASGLMIIGHVASIGQDVLNLSASTAAYVVSILAIANTGGRVFWGYMSDRFGRYPILIVIYTISAAMMLTMTNINSFWPFILVVSAIVMCYGGLLGTYPSVIAERFGLKNLGLNYGIIFTGYAVAGFVGPRLAATIKETDGNYTKAFLIAAFWGICGAVLALLVLWRARKKHLISLTSPSVQKSSSYRY